MYTEKQTKNILTKQTIAEELLREGKKSRLVSFLYLILVTFFGELVCLLIYVSDLAGRERGAIHWILYFSLVIACMIPLLFVIFSIPAWRSMQKRLKNGDFFVITDTVVYKEEKTIRRRRSIRAVKILHFQSFGDIHVGSTYYPMTSSDDVFYMVVFSEDSKAPIKYYPAKLYEYKE
ncbi:MAG: hypothetical protein E7606_05070 [Ruminococcaceae bacterium]|nr:hypothetical protein [Oscillospiraceae bacterium]